MMRILAVLRLLVVIAFYDGTVTVPMNTRELAIRTDTMLIAGFLGEEIRAAVASTECRSLGISDDCSRPKERLYVAKAAPYHS